MEKIDVSIIIPTKNAGDLFDKVLDKIFSQETKYSYEVICVDSGSKDNTINFIKNYNCKLYQIPANEFGHGKTRNYGASKGSGEFIIFITQDAMPATNTWIENFINAMKLDDKIAGGFGIHYPYPNCNLLDKRILDVHFLGFGTDNTIYQLEDKQRYKNDEGYRHLLSFFSDNNSCLRRNIWEKYPYEDVDFAEDQIWARKIIELGYKKLYCPYAPVYHSHNYKLSTYFGRYFDEYKGLYNLHQYVIVQHLYQVIPNIFKAIVADSLYLLKQDIKFFLKIKWIWYSICRNHCRFLAGYLGGRYHLFPKKIQEFLNQRISQQYKQIKR